MQTLSAFVQMIADNQPLPKMKWSVNGGDAAGLSIEVDKKAKQARLWTADSRGRDFRNDKWSSRSLEITGGSSRAKAEVPKAASGYRPYKSEIVLARTT